MNLFTKDETDSQTLKNLRFPNETGWGDRDALGVWDGNVVKLGCDDGCTTINIIRSSIWLCVCVCVCVCVCRYKM